MLTKTGKKKVCILYHRCPKWDVPHSTVNAVRRKMLKEFKCEEIEEDCGKDHGWFLAGNAMNLYHIISIKPGIWVGSFHRLTPTQTRPLARKFLAK